MLIPEVLEKFSIDIIEKLVGIEYNGGESDFKLTLEVYDEDLGYSQATDIHLFFEDRELLIYVQNALNEDYEPTTKGLVLEKTVAIISKVISQFKCDEEINED